MRRNEMQICFLSLAKCCALRPRIGLSLGAYLSRGGGMVGDCTDNFIDAGAISWMLYSGQKTKQRQRLMTSTSHHQDIYDTYFVAFCSARDRVHTYSNGIAPKVFGIKGEVPIAFERLLDLLIIEVHDAHLAPLPNTALTVIADYLHHRAVLHAKRPEEPGYGYSNDPYEPLNQRLLADAESKEANKLSDGQPHLILAVLAVMQFSQMLPVMQKKGLKALRLAQILHLQQTVERCIASAEQHVLRAVLAEHVSPTELKKQIAAAEKEQLRKKAQHAAKKKAEMLYGDAKEYVRKRYNEAKAKSTKLNLSQLSQKITDELEEKFGSKLHLENPQDRVYRWLRALKFGAGYIM
jgi:hypothetical protein